MDTLKKLVLNVIVPVIIFGGVILTIYWAVQDDPRIAENERIIDSLRLQVMKYEKRHDSLMIIVRGLDVEISERERIIDSLMKYKPEPPKPQPPPKPSEARKILDNFRKG